MLPSSSKRLRVYLALEQPTLAVIAGGRQPQLLQLTSLPPAPSWAEAVVALDDWLAAHAERYHVEVLLATSLVRFLTVAWDPAVTDRETRMALAQALLEQAYQVQAKDYRLVLDESPYGWPQTVVAVESALCEALQGVFDKHQLRLDSLQPLAAVVWNRFVRQLPATLGLFVVQEADRATLFWYQGRQIVDVAVKPTGAASLGDNMAAWLAGRGETQGVAFAPALPPETLDGSGIQRLQLHRDADQTNPSAAYALCGVW